jgi:hypothetical protein
MKCYVGECLCYDEEEIAKAKRNCLGDGIPFHNSSACWQEE